MLTLVLLCPLPPPPKTGQAYECGGASSGGRKEHVLLWHRGWRRRGGAREGRGWGRSRLPVYPRPSVRAAEPVLCV